MYVAPEVLTSTAANGYDAAHADMWSLGIILFSMLSGTLPFQCAAASRCKRYEAVLQQGIQVMCPEHLSPMVVNLLSRMLDPNPARRYSPTQALECEWFRDSLPPHLTLGPEEANVMLTWSVLMKLASRKGSSRIVDSASGGRRSEKQCAEPGCGGEPATSFRKRERDQDESEGGSSSGLAVAVQSEGRQSGFEPSSSSCAACASASQSGAGPSCLGAVNEAQVRRSLNCSRSLHSPRPPLSVLTHALASDFYVTIAENWNGGDTGRQREQQISRAAETTVLQRFSHVLFMRRSDDGNSQLRHWQLWQSA